MTRSIGAIAQQTGLPPDTLRYYEKIGLLRKVARDPGGRRRYDDADLSRLRFIQRAQRCNFSLGEIRELLELRDRPGPPRSEAQRLTERKLAEMAQQLADLNRLHGELQLLLNLCRGGEEGCPIIEGFEAGDVERPAR
ncbi:MAG: heavy metal-responsive transcriptional regulator [Gammaproteobacteria bacterium]|nr:heavy metal-responsive transcriptional regulator [Gammaproteobacteria bacterium]